MTVTFDLNDGNKIPAVGLGVYQASSEETYDACMTALKLGYRHIDTAALYGNETEVGKAVKDSGIPRSEIFITTKLWNDSHGYDETLAACEKSLKKLGTYIDLYLIHAPVEGKRLDTWRAFEKLKKDGKVKSIGVSNYNVHHLEEILKNPMFEFKPCVNQIEIHPFLYKSRLEVINFCKKEKILLEAYSPLTRGKKLGEMALVSLAENYKKTPAQLLVRWCLEKGFVTLPKSARQDRIIENFSVFDWKISASDINLMDSWDRNLNVAWNPLEWD